QRVLESITPNLLAARRPSVEVKTNSEFRGMALTISTALGDNGTECCLPSFMRSAGVVHTAPSISSQRAPRASPDPAAVRLANSTALADGVLRERKRAINSGACSYGRAL